MLCESTAILSCKDVSIRYMTGDFKSIGLKEWVMRRLTGRYQVKEFWADRDVTFSLEKGDMLGIIGTNGAGKSTLLKVISGIMEPTEGQVRRRGKIAALLELASGFDGDLTVKENAYLRGAMLGYTRAFMDRTYERIIDFAELKEFEDRPFKQLSSGMKSRLAFSIASLVKPEILILDEVLSVGDGAFRRKSEAKMREIIKGGATTILVSHAISQVRDLCNKVLWLDRGRQIAFTEDVKGVCAAYVEFLQQGGEPRFVPSEKTPDTNDYVVALNALGGTGGTVRVIARYGQRMRSVVKPTRPGYTFGGYYTTTTGKGVRYYDSNGNSAHVWDRASNAATLYAYWIPNAYKVALNELGGSGGTAQVTVRYGQAMPPVAKPTRVGYRFGGYFTTTTGRGMQYYDANGASTHAWDRASNAATLYAYWVKE